MDNEIQTKDKEKTKENGKSEKSMDTPSNRPEAENTQTVTKERIERVKKTFRSTGLVKALNSQDNNKGK